MSDSASPPACDEQELDAIRVHNARLGLLLFAIYFVIYAVFVGLNTFAPQVMIWSGIAGIALALWYGMALIFGALFMAVIYLLLCRSPQTKNSGGPA